MGLLVISEARQSVIEHSRIVIVWDARIADVRHRDGMYVAETALIRTLYALATSSAYLYTPLLALLCYSMDDETAEIELVGLYLSRHIANHDRHA